MFDWQSRNFLKKSVNLLASSPQFEAFRNHAATCLWLALDGIISRIDVKFVTSECEIQKRKIRVSTYVDILIAGTEISPPPPIKQSEVTPTPSLIKKPEVLPTPTPKMQPEDKPAPSPTKRPEATPTQLTTKQPELKPTAQPLTKPTVQPKITEELPPDDGTSPVLEVLTPENESTLF